jgi:hypothetical protein
VDATRAQRDKHSSFAISTAEAILYAMRLPIELASDIGASDELDD